MSLSMPTTVIPAEHAAPVREAGETECHRDRYGDSDDAAGEGADLFARSAQRDARHRHEAEPAQRELKVELTDGELRQEVADRRREVKVVRYSVHELPLAH